MVLLVGWAQAGHFLDLLVYDLSSFLRNLNLLQFLGEILNFFVWGVLASHST